MPSAALPAAATDHMSSSAITKLSDKIDQLPFETYVRIYYSNYGSGDEEAIEGLLVEYDATHWAERTQGEIFYYNEISETRDQAVLYDASRDVTIIVDYDDYDVSFLDADGRTDYLLDDIGETLYPVIPPYIIV